MVKKHSRSCTTNKPTLGSEWNYMLFSYFQAGKRYGMLLVESAMLARSLERNFACHFSYAFPQYGGVKYKQLIRIRSNYVFFLLSYAPTRTRLHRKTGNPNDRTVLVGLFILVDLNGIFE